jgi:hypothetical protein
MQHHQRLAIALSQVVDLAVGGVNVSAFHADTSYPSTAQDLPPAVLIPSKRIRHLFVAGLGMAADFTCLHEPRYSTNG